MLTCKESSYCLVFHDYNNKCNNGYLNSYVQALSSALLIPHPKGNEYHTICYNESGIMYSWDIVKEMDNTTPVGRPEFDVSINMEAVGLML